MAIEIKVPVLPESVSDATVVTWHKKAGDSVLQDDTLVDLETDKVVLEVPAIQDGVLSQILQEEGAIVTAGVVLGILEEGTVDSAGPATAETISATASNEGSEKSGIPGPAARRLAAENQVDTAAISGSGKGGRVVTNDVKKSLGQGQAAVKLSTAQTVAAPDGRPEKRVAMTRLRARIAERLLEAQHSTAMLTTFNEVNLQKVIELRKKYKDEFEKDYGVRLGFMSFFTKATVEALKRFPSVNASIDGSEVVYHGYYDVGIAVSTERGLVVPVLRNVDQMSMADVEHAIVEYAEKARIGRLILDEMTGGTFTLTNGGVFGSLLATPILNPPQSGILGMHKIEERPVVENGEIVIRPMMYLALSYDHRIIDGKESVNFLVTIKELLEDPARLLLDI